MPNMMGDGYINLCLAVLGKTKEDNTQMWKDFIQQNDISKRNWSATELAFWVANWWQLEQAGQTVFDQDEPLEPEGRLD